MPNIPFVCSLRFKKDFVFIFNELIALFAVPFAESMCVCVSAVEYKNEEEASITEVFYGSFCFIDFNRANDKRKRFRFLPKAIAEIYLYLNLNYVFCERARALNGAQINCIMSVRAMLDCSYTVFGSVSAWREWACVRTRKSVFGSLFSFSFLSFPNTFGSLVVCE